jgi:uncharacterized protein YdeI (YjbR/CyaY-like superfamily)
MRVVGPRIQLRLRSSSGGLRPNHQIDFHALAPSHRRRYVGWIETAKREETKPRRLKEAIRLLAAGKPLGLK